MQVYNKRLCNCDIFRPRNCGRKFCATNNRATVLHNCASQMCSTIVLHNCAPQLWSTIVLHKSFSQLPSLLPLLPSLPLRLPLVLPKLCLPTITCSSASSEGWYGEKLGIFSVWNTTSQNLNQIYLSKSIKRGLAHLDRNCSGRSETLSDEELTG